jgi:hypothetical protein
MRVSKKSALSEFRFGAPVAQDSAILLAIATALPNCVTASEAKLLTCQSTGERQQTF